MNVSRTLPRLLAIACVFALVGCKSDVTTVSIAPPTPLSGSQYSLEVTGSAAAATAGEAVTFTARLLDPQGEDVTELFEIRNKISPALGALNDGEGQYRFTFEDTYTFFASAEVLGTDLVGAATVDVTPGPGANLSIQVDQPLTDAGVPVTVSSEVTDAYGNDAEGNVVYSVDPSATVAGNEITALTIGSYEVTGSLTGTEAIDTDDFTVLAGAPASLDITLSSYDVERGQGLQVLSVVLDQYGNVSDHPVELSTNGGGTEAWGEFVRFHDEGIFTVFADITEYDLHDEDGPVLVDSSGPQIRVTTPTRGAEIPSASNPSVMVTGSVVDPWTGVTSVNINGEAATLLAGGLFEYEMTPEQGLNFIDVVATDGDNNVSDHFQTYLWGEFLPPGEPNEDGMLARLNEGAIEVIEDLASDLFVNADLAASLTGLPLWSNSQQTCLPIVGCITWWNLTAGVSAVTLGELDIDLDPRPGYLEFYGAISPFSISLGLWGNVFALGSVNIGGTVAASSAIIESDVFLWVDGSNEIQVSMSNSDVSLPGFSLSIYGAGFIGDLLNAVLGWLAPVLQGAIELVLPPVIDSQLPGLIEGALADIEIAFEMDLLGTPLVIGALPQQIDIDEDGMTIRLESLAEAGTPSPTAPPTLGSFRRSDYGVPTYELVPDFSISMADNFVNQLLHAVWQAGVMEFSLDSAELGLDLSSIGDFLPLTSISFETLPLLPPVVGPSEVDDSLELAFGDMLVNVYGDPGGTPGLMMQLAVTIQAEAELGIDANSEIQFGIGDTEIIMNFVTSDWPDLDGEVAENLMDAVVDLIIPQVTGVLDDIGGIPIPELPGFTLGTPQIVREASPVFYITAEGDLVLTN